MHAKISSEGARIKLSLLNYTAKNIPFPSSLIMPPETRTESEKHRVSSIFFLPALFAPCLLGDKPRSFHSLIRSFVSEGDRYATAAKNVRLVAKDSASVSPSAYAFMILLVRCLCQSHSGHMQRVKAVS